MNLSDLDRYLRPFRRRLAGAVVRGVWRFGYSGGKSRTGQVSLLRGELRDKVEAPEQYGFASEPQDDAEAFGVRVGANSDHLVVLCVGDRRYRLSGMAKGEVAIYDDSGTKIHLKRGGKIEIVAAGGTKITGDVSIVGNLDVHGEATILQDVTAGGTMLAAAIADSTGPLGILRTKYNNHTHQENGSGGGITDPPNLQA